MRRVLITISIPFLTAISFAGCTPVAPVEPIEIGRPGIILPELSDTCGAGPLAELIGQNFSVLSGLPISDLRVIMPGQMVTTDFSPSRLNAEVDSLGIIRRLYCG